MLSRQIKKQISLLVSQNYEFHITKTHKKKVESILPAGNERVNLKF